MIQKIKNFLKDEEGATAVEYGIMVAAIAAVVITAAILLGQNVDGAFDNVNNAMETNGLPGGDPSTTN
jgi:pilus assembly protein Flp/PilA